MACVSSVRYAVKINGKVLNLFTPSRGLRQGDPLSPYLFLFIGEALTSLIRKEAASGHISPLKIARGAPGITNLLFADDCLLFFKASTEEEIVVDHII